jgi:hypothetical protein
MRIVQGCYASPSVRSVREAAVLRGDSLWLSYVGWRTPCQANAYRAPAMPPDHA